MTKRRARAVRWTPGTLSDSGGTSRRVAAGEDRPRTFANSAPEETRSIARAHVANNSGNNERQDTLHLLPRRGAVGARRLPS